jgi:hypothetical protein
VKKKANEGLPMEIVQAGGESWVSYLLALQNGFFRPFPPSTSGIVREEPVLDVLGIELIE